jgi:hypothetical protein
MPRMNQSHIFPDFITEISAIKVLVNRSKLEKGKFLLKSTRSHLFAIIVFSNYF